MNRMYFTITGLYHYYGDKFLEKGNECHSGKRCGQ